MRRVLHVIVPLLIVILAGCTKRDDHAPASGGGHVHKAPHGGTLVELGEHAFNLELVHDAAGGKLTAYVLDAHAEDFVRIPAPAIELVAKMGGEQKPLTLRAVANNMTGETVGNTSQFEGQAEWLKTASTFEGVISSLEIRGRKFERVAFRFPTGSGKN